MRANALYPERGASVIPRALPEEFHKITLMRSQ